MTIEFGKERGFINKGNSLKVYMKEDKESPWVKVVAIHKNKKKCIGILQNTLLSKRFNWGILVLIEEKNENEIPRIIKKVSEIPNKIEWRLI